MNKKQGPTRRGILGGGNWIVDQVKLVDVYPQRDQLANISSQYQGTGGAPYNVLVDLANLGCAAPLHAAGLVGKDPLGASIIQDCKQRRINTRHLRVTDKAPTSYTDVMTEESNGRRTFFHLRGANALWTGRDLDFTRIRSAIFHLGYLLLLDAMDLKDAKYGTKAARLLASAQAAGMKTCVDVVSEDSDRFARIVVPALRHVDYCILNEIEAGNTVGIALRKSNGRLDVKALHHATQALLEHGVREMVVVHFPEGGFVKTRAGQTHSQPSVNLPKNYIAGSAGAGDAFCAGMLLGLHEHWEVKSCLQSAVCVAAASLSNPTCTGGVGALKSCSALARKYGYRKSMDGAL